MAKVTMQPWDSPEGKRLAKLLGVQAVFVIDRSKPTTKKSTKKQKPTNKPTEEED